MLDILTIGSEVAARRQSLRLSQSEVANRAGISRATLDALENGRTGEHGYSKITRLLSVLGLELKLQPATSQESLGEVPLAGSGRGHPGHLRIRTSDQSDTPRHRHAASPNGPLRAQHPGGSREREVAF